MRVMISKMRHDMKRRPEIMIAVRAVIQVDAEDLSVVGCNSGPRVKGMLVAGVLRAEGVTAQSCCCTPK